MDVDKLLNLERRTGVKNADIDDFERKVNDVEAAIKGLVAGTLKPEDVKVEGIDTEEEKAEKERLRLERKKILEEKEKKLKEERKKEERERWWAGVEIFSPKKQTSESTIQGTFSEEEVDKKTIILNRYKADYSRWSSWTPTDEASLAEAAEIAQKEEELKNKEFEKNNAEFCSEFLTDMDKRKKITEKKQESADISRLKGNRYFKAKAYDKALEYYMEALKDCPFDAKTLNNIAQVCIKTKDFEDALEFLSRTLYLEPENIKALSRKALVLGERGATSEAVQVINAALALEPHNADLISQARELRVIEKERADEKIVAASIVGMVASNSSTVVETVGQVESSAVDRKKTTSASVVDGLFRCLQNVIEMCSLTPASNNEVKEYAELKVAILATTEAVREKTDLKIYARTCGALDSLIVFIKASIDSRVDNQQQTIILPLALRLLALLADGQRSAKLALLDQKVLSCLKALVQSTLLVDPEATEAALQVILVFCVDDIAVKARAAVLSDKQILEILATLLGNISFKINSSNTKLVSEERSIVELCGKVLKIIAFTDGATSSLSTIEPVTGVSLVASIACAVHMMNNAPTHSSSPTSNVELLELLLEVALGLSQVEILRPHFAQITPLAENKVNKSSFSASLSATIINAITSRPELEVNATAALMNACFEPSGVVRKNIIDSGGLPLAMDQLSLTELQRKTIDGVALVRKAGLLARLAGDPVVQNSLLQAENYRHLCRRIALPPIEAGQEMEKWVLAERAHYVRILANLTAPSPECMRIGLEENIFASLLAVFPTPRDDCGEITAASVTLVPKDLAPALLLGNAARCLMPYADIPSHADILYGNKKLLGTEKMICAMASCPDMRVRKNIAILLAKGCRVSGVREKMTELRGMQMMIELQKSL